MTYMVVECHPGYAVVLDEEGSFLKVANRRYDVGQMVTDVEPMQVPPKKKIGKWVTSLVAAAACLALVLGITLPGGHAPYASVYVKINPEVRIDVDKEDLVVGLEGVNQDGVTLIEGYDYQNKHLDLVTDELVDKAIDMGYLQPEGQITISLDSQDETWVQNHSEALSSHLQTHLQERITVTIEIKLCTHEHPGTDHRDYDYDDDDDDDDDDGIYRDPENPNRVEIQPDLDDDDDRNEEQEDHHDEEDPDDHDDDHDDHDDDDDDDDDDDEDDDD